MVNLGFRASRTPFLQVLPRTPHRTGAGYGVTASPPPADISAPDFTAAALTADEVPVLRHLDENHVVPELQLIERSSPPDDGSRAEAMHSERCLAARSGVGNGHCGLATCHTRKVAASWRFVIPPRTRVVASAGPSAIRQGQGDPRWRPAQRGNHRRWCCRLSSRVLDGPRRHRLEAHQLSVREWPDAGMVAEKRWHQPSTSRRGRWRCVISSAGPRPRAVSLRLSNRPAGRHHSF